MYFWSIFFVLIPILAFAQSVPHYFSLSLVQSQDCKLYEYGVAAPKTEFPTYSSGLVFEGTYTPSDRTHKEEKCVVRISRQDFESKFSFCALSGSEQWENRKNTLSICHFWVDRYGIYRFEIQGVKGDSCSWVCLKLP